MLHFPGRSTAKKRDATRHALLEAALNVFGEKGYHAAAVDDIVARAGRSKGAAYFHFPSKEAIFRALVRELATMLAGRVDREIEHETDPVQKLDAALLSVIEIFTKHRTLARIVLIELTGAGRPFTADLMFARDQFTQLIKRNLDSAVECGAIPACDTELIATAWFGAVNEVVVRWLSDGAGDSLHVRFPSLRHLLLRSVGLEIAADSAPGAAVHA